MRMRGDKTSQGIAWRIVCHHVSGAHRGEVYVTRAKCMSLVFNRTAAALNMYTGGNRQRYRCWPGNVRWGVIQSDAIYPCTPIQDKFVPWSHDDRNLGFTTLVTRQVT
eukprot:6213167-Pleurochrysis_carterae.AAC.1